jgi:hypothetical protein
MYYIGVARQKLGNQQNSFSLMRAKLFSKRSRFNDLDDR